MRHKLRTLAFLGLICALAAPNQEVRATEAWNHAGGKNLRKAITTNTGHYWAWARGNGERFLKGYLGPEGQVIGDPHLRNVFDFRSGPRSKPKLAIADLDDGGRAPLILDMGRFLVYLKAAEVDLKIKEVFEAYVQGLKGHELPAPKLMRDAAEMSAADIEEKHARYIEKHTEEGKFSADLGIVLRSDMSRAQKAEADALVPDVLKLTGQKKVWDTGFTSNDSGSSAGLPRYWFLVGDEAGPKRLMEGKKFKEPAVAEIRPQLPHSTRVKELMKAYSDGMEKSYFGVGEVRGDSYWLRPRKFQALDLADNDVSEKHQDEFALYMANWMGLKQRDQSGGAPLLRLIEKDQQAAKDALKEFVQEYLSVVEKL